MEKARHAAPSKREVRRRKHTKRRKPGGPVILRAMGVFLTAGVALACLGLLRFRTPGIVLGPFESEPTAESTLLPDSTPEPEQEPEPEPEPAQPVTTTIRFSATGDNLIHSPIYKQAARRASAGQKYDFDYCYAHLLDFYAQQDVNWINQETLCSSELEPSTYPCFSTPGECAESLYRAGIRVFSLSNNHTYDKGAAGLAATQRFWAQMPEDVVTTGLWNGPSDYGRIPLQTVNGVTIAYLSYTEHTNGIPQNSAMTANVIYTNQLDIIQQQVTQARQLADFVVVGVHWGVENSHTITNAQRTLAQQLSDWGSGSDPRDTSPCGAERRVAYFFRRAADLCGLFPGKFSQHPEQAGSAHRCDPDRSAGENHCPGRQRFLRSGVPGASPDGDALRCRKVQCAHLPVPGLYPGAGQSPRRPGRVSRFRDGFDPEGPGKQH